MEVAIKIHDLTKKYGGVRVVDHLNFEIYHGEIFSLLGPNGAGKTTTLLMLTTVIKPTEGTAIIYGHDIRKEPDKVRELVGIAFQDPKLFWIQTPLDILMWHARVCGLRGDRARRKVEEVMKALNLWEARKEKAHYLSGGMRKRVEVAKVLIQEPKVAIFDEPTSEIDVAGRHFIWDSIRALREKGSTIILATNNLYEADKLSDRVCIIHKGKVVALGKPKELKDTIIGGELIELNTDRNPPENTIKRIKQLKNVIKVMTRGRNIRIYLNRAKEVAPKIIEVFHKDHVAVRSMSMTEPSLDDVFLYYTGSTIKEVEGSGKGEPTENLAGS
ncbi:ABC transporter [Candidatus Geothermarchaeota archaeon]|nr:MAG: ABC transporter [Candidatus Geothermarchaeota archaeon]